MSLSWQKSNSEFLYFKHKIMFTDKVSKKETLTTKANLLCCSETSVVIVSSNSAFVFGMMFALVVFENFL